MKTIIQTNQLTKSFRHETAIHPLDFTLQQGEICALIGKNGAGKSTFFKMLSGQILPSSGDIALFGQSGKDCGLSRKRIGFIVETPTFFPDFTARQNLEYFRIQRGIAEKKQIQRVLEIVGLAQEKKKKFEQYSLGMKQRLGLALCLLGNPDCLILDEPINGLDAEGIKEIRELLFRLNREQQITILISSHILSELSLLATRFLFIKQGTIIEDISSETLHEKSKKQLKIHTANLSKAVQILERTYPDIDYKVLPDNYLALQNYVDKSQEINRLLVKNEILVDEFRVESLALEDYFLTLEEETNQ
ncbi:ATP-binding cassette domain-containing protein [Tetragenococcus koreensis]|uniref:ABC transporter ATP-binding protein n=1 Tax=Tetragenococcus koreensis TaxID=290335 RepID=A0AAN4RJZ4_9ENTE|nr:ATP-binding cassette domain-containing protein [Tetragenococcus koreensis]MDN5832055.1 ATP-binding cassette domain-containing protein [Tetragenococcus halophilus]MCF1617549.1 ATP-binding cassette domain-containing protein [Tetragenococcus koreensis]MCF1622946.1 ATP-binding cassette domain-containing protein [Tetragenococcus koreensis]MCF1626273.1 ATP-binding cassette domain-containing protein [Tetragenococcus koreensis]MCF1678441.1 ATP-binding cassette domain-containing protein [Tetragenoco